MIHVHDTVNMDAATPLFNVYVSDISCTFSKKFQYANDISRAIKRKDLRVYVCEVIMEGNLVQMSGHECKLRPNPDKIEVVSLHLHGYMASTEYIQNTSCHVISVRTLSYITKHIDKHFDFRILCISNYNNALICDRFRLRVYHRIVLKKLHLGWFLR